MPADPISAGRKGGSRNTPAQQAARKKGQFRRVYSRADEQQPHQTEQESQPAVLIELDELEPEQ